MTEPVTVMIDGRPYLLRLDAPNCDSQRHRHAEPHADGTPSTDGDVFLPHHHHTERCGELPRQATLIPAWELAYQPHVHCYDDGDCACGAWREDLSDSKQRRPGDPEPAWHLVGYHNPPDTAHPEGWSYERKETT